MAERGKFKTKIGGIHVQFLGTLKLFLKQMEFRLYLQNLTSILDNSGGCH